MILFYDLYVDGSGAPAPASVVTRCYLWKVYLDRQVEDVFPFLLAPAPPPLAGSEDGEREGGREGEREERGGREEGGGRGRERGMQHRSHLSSQGDVLKCHFC